MKELVFDFNENKVRTCLINNEPYFSVGDVGKVLKLTNVYRQVKNSKGCHTVTTLTKGGNQEVLFIPEPVLYELIFQSRKENAKKFQQWIFEEVLPSIRKTGKYEVESSLKKISTEHRNLLTDAWKESGCTEPKHYINLTREEYRLLFNDIKKKKANMTRQEILTLSALESMEMLNLHLNPRVDYNGCKESLNDTVKRLPTKKTEQIQ